MSLPRFFFFWALPIIKAHEHTIMLKVAGGRPVGDGIRFLWGVFKGHAATIVNLRAEESKMTRGEVITFLLGLVMGGGSVAVLSWWLLGKVQRDLRRVIRELESGLRGKATADRKERGGK